MKPEKKNRALQGIGIGIGVFALLSAICLLTPLRKPILAVTGRDTPALEYRLQAQRDTLDALQTRASSARLSPAERATLESVRNAYVATRERIDARAQMNSRLTLLGLFDWIQELFPWLIAFGLALPVLGGLIGAQVGVQAQSTPTPAAAPHIDRPPVVPPSRPVVPPVPSRPVVPPVTPSVVPPSATGPRTPYVHPAAAAAAPAAASRPLPGSPVIMPPPVTPVAPAPTSPPAPEQPAQDWGFRHQPTPLESRPRTKLPPVRSPHILSDATDEAASDETPQA